MSGVLGLLSLQGSPVSESDLRQMASFLVRRGPEGVGLSARGVVGLGHTVLATTPEATWERLPLTHAETGCVITADVRLDNRDELLRALGLVDRSDMTGDGELLLAAYLRWDSACVEHILGDFAFAIWDPRVQRLFCARDHFGMRPFYYHHTRDRVFAFASEPRAILVLPQVPYRINEARIADFLVSELEGVDYTSTFFEEVYRLPPAHSISVTPRGVQVQRYWQLEAGPELRLSSDGEYAEAFLEVFTSAVRSRLRSAKPVGSMLSGGVDSGSVVAVASEILAQEGRGPLDTFSATAPDASGCIETQMIHASMQMKGLRTHSISYGDLEELQPELDELTRNLDEPFDAHMTLPRAVYLLAHRRGINVMLDGVAGDVVLSRSAYLPRLVRSGRWIKAMREAIAQNRFWKGSYPAWRELGLSARSAIAFQPVRNLREVVLGSTLARRRMQKAIRESCIDAAFARRVSLDRRLKTLDRFAGAGLQGSYGMDCVRSMDQPHLVVARERYERAAAPLAIEPRDPFLDRRVVAFCLTLPGPQRLEDGWPKMILRRAMVGRLPETVCWRLGKEHLGWSFTQALTESSWDDFRKTVVSNLALLASYVSQTTTEACRDAEIANRDLAANGRLYDLFHVARWLRGNSLRPTVLDFAEVGGGTEFKWEDGR